MDERFTDEDVERVAEALRADLSENSEVELHPYLENAVCKRYQRAARAALLAYLDQ